MYENLKSTTLSKETLNHNLTVENIKLQKSCDVKDLEIKDILCKMEKVKKEFEEFKLSLNNISYFQQKESDNLKIIDILKKDIDYKDNLLKLTKDK